MNYREIKSRIEVATKHFAERVHVCGKENSKNYAAGLEYLEALAASIVTPQEEDEPEEE